MSDILRHLPVKATKLLTAWAGGRTSYPEPPHPGGSEIAFWKNSDTIERLKAAFANDATKAQACVAAGITRSSYYAYRKKNPDIVARWEELNLNNNLKAKSNIINKIHKGNVELSKWYLERKEKSYIEKTQHNMANADGKNIKLQSVVIPIEVEPPEYAERDPADSTPAPAKAD